MNITVTVMRTPSIQYNGSKLMLPYRKAEAVVFILTVEHQISRDRMCNLLWENYSEAAAQKNLRNAIYAIKKSTQSELLNTSDRRILSLSGDAVISSDYLEIENYVSQPDASEASVLKFINLYKNDFLHEFIISDSDEFSSWTSEKSLKIKRLFCCHLKEQINYLIQEQRFELAGMCCEKMIELDEYDENNYMLLFQCLKEQHQVSEIIRLFGVVKKRFAEELNILPSVSFSDYYTAIIQTVSEATPSIQSTPPLQSFFLGRNEELSLFQENYFDFLVGHPYQFFLIYGESGIGKSCLIEQIESKVSSIYVKYCCNMIDMKYEYKTLDALLGRLVLLLEKRGITVSKKLILSLANCFPSVNEYMKENSGPDNRQFDHKAVPESPETLIFQLFSELCETEKPVILLDDVQWCDNRSMETIENIASVFKDKVMMVFACREEPSFDIENFYIHLINLKPIKKIKLERFTKQETDDYILRCAPQLLEQNELIFAESEGNPLFIREIIQSLSSGLPAGQFTQKLESVIGSRLSILSREQMNLLCTASVFQHKFYLKQLALCLEQTEMELIDNIDSLLHMNILKEEVGLDGIISLDFSHQKMREYVYQKISASKKSFLHKKIAAQLEKLLCNNFSDVLQYPYIIYHFTKANDKEKMYHYRVLDMKYRLNIEHEIFPIANSDEIEHYIGYGCEDDVLKTFFSEMDLLWKKLDPITLNGTYHTRMMYLFIYGRYYKNKGDSKKCIPALHAMIELAAKLEQFDYVCEGYIQLIQHYINTNNLGEWENCLDYMSSELLHLSEAYTARINLYRGYLYILKGMYTEGETILLHSAETFKNPEKISRYFLHLAAIYLYLGESCYLQGNCEEAVTYYFDAFDYCDEDRDFAAVAVILSKLGIAKFVQKDFSSSRYYLRKSIEKYNKTMFYWGKSTAYQYLAELARQDGDRNSSQMYAEQAKIYQI